VAVLGFAGDGVLGLVGYLFAEVVACAKNFAADVDDVLGVGNGFAVHQKEIITRAGGERNFSDGDAAASGEIQHLGVLHDPA
jgi:hypothetical protein